MRWRRLLIKAWTYLEITTPRHACTFALIWPQFSHVPVWHVVVENRIPLCQKYTSTECLIQKILTNRYM